MTEERLEKIKRVLGFRQPDLQVVLENVKNPHNMSAVFRTCDAVGVQYVHVVNEGRCAGFSKGISKSAEQWIDIRFHTNIEESFSRFRKEGMRVYVTAISPETVDFRDCDYTVPCAVVFGNEREGVSKEALELADQAIFIPMKGFVQSFNISVAAAIILYEAMSQREKAGLYKNCRLSDKEYKRLFEEWKSR
jgi:tRNA (guanosine-2'-O-)-methyltransferase